MIAVDFSKESRSLIDAFGISPDMVVTTVNNRDRGVLDPGINRLIAVHWFSENEAILVDSTVTHKSSKGREVNIERVRAMLAIKLEAKLPSGRVTQESELEALMITVAESFGHPVSFHESARPEVLYSGPWDGKPVRISDVRGEEDLLVLATINPTDNTAFAGWAFNLQRYMRWLRRGQLPQPFSVKQRDDQGFAETSDLKFSEKFLSENAGKFGIRPNQVLEALRAPDKADEIEFHGLVIRIQTKTLGTQPSSTLLVIESVQEGERRVDSAFRIYPELARDLNELRPLELLRRFTDSFGLLIRVGGQTGKLILHESFEIKGGNLIEGLEAPRGSMIQEMYLRIDEGPLKTAHCALAFCIETDLYSSWLKSMVRNVH